MTLKWCRHSDFQLFDALPSHALQGGFVAFENIGFLAIDPERSVLHCGHKPGCSRPPLIPTAAEWLRAANACR